MCFFGKDLHVLNNSLSFCCCHSSNVSLYVGINKEAHCHNPSLGLTTKARAYKVTGQKGSLGVTMYAPRSVGKCEGMNPHNPKVASTLGVGIPMDS
jgi:hypothetical protein